MPLISAYCIFPNLMLNHNFPFSKLPCIKLQSPKTCAFHRKRPSLFQLALARRAQLGRHPFILQHQASEFLGDWSGRNSLVQPPSKKTTKHIKTYQKKYQNIVKILSLILSNWIDFQITRDKKGPKDAFHKSSPEILCQTPDRSTGPFFKGWPHFRVVNSPYVCLWTAIFGDQNILFWQCLTFFGQLNNVKLCYIMLNPYVYRWNHLLLPFDVRFWPRLVARVAGCRSAKARQTRWVPPDPPPMESQS